MKIVHIYDDQVAEYLNVLKIILISSIKYQP